MVMEIKLTQGKVALVDDRDYAYLSQFNWHAQKDEHNFYACRADKEYYKMHKKKKVIKMHREILNPEKNMLVDHINHNGLDNTRENIRIVTHKENQRNQSVCSINTSGFAGVYWHKPRNKWRATIYVEGKRKDLGRFSKIEDAIEARKNALIKYGYHENHGKRLGDIK